MNVKICMILATITGILILVNIYKNKVREGFFQGHYYEKLISGVGPGYTKRQCMGMDKDDKKIFCVTNTPINNPSIINPSIIPKSCIWDNNEGLDKWRETVSSTFSCDTLYNQPAFDSLKDDAFNPLKLQKSERMHVVDACRTKNPRWETPICSKVDVASLRNISVSKIKKKGFHLIDLTNEPDQSYDKLKKIVEERGYILPTADDLERFIALEDNTKPESERGYPITWSKRRDDVAYPTFSGKDVWMPTSDGDWIQGGDTPHPPGTSHIKDLKVKPVWHNLDKWKTAAYRGYILAFDKNATEIQKQDDANIKKVRDFKSKITLSNLTDNAKITTAESKLNTIKSITFKSEQATNYSNEMNTLLDNIESTISKAKSIITAKKAAAEKAAAVAKAEADRKAAAAAAAAKAEADRKAAAEAEKKQIESYQQEIKRLSIIIEKTVEEANKQESILESSENTATQQQITDVIKPDITSDTEGIINNNNNIQKILNNFNNSKQETLKNLEKSKELSNDSQKKIINIQTNVKNYKTDIEQKILSIKAEKERKEKLRKEREQLLKNGQQLKSKLQSLDTTKSQLLTEISNLESNGLNSQSKIKSFNSEILDTKNENSKIDSNIKKYKIKKYEGVVKQNSDYINDTYPLIITDNNNEQNDDKNNQSQHIDGFTTIASIISNKPYQRNILSKNNITDEYD